MFAFHIVKFILLVPNDSGYWYLFLHFCILELNYSFEII